MQMNIQRKLVQLLVRMVLKEMKMKIKGLGFQSEGNCNNFVLFKTKKILLLGWL